MRKVIMGVGTFLALLGLIQLILSVALIGPVRAQIPEIDRFLGDAAATVTGVADSVDRGAAFLADLDPDLAQAADTIGKTIDDSVRQLGELDADLARAEGEVVGAIDGTVRFLGDLDGTLAEVERPLGIIDDTVRYLDGLDASMALTERWAGATLDGSVKTLGELDASLVIIEGSVGATLDASLKYLGELDTALADVDGVIAATIDGTLIFLGDVGTTLAEVDETLTRFRGDVIFTRNSITDMLELYVVDIRPEDLDLLAAPAHAVLADAERTVAEMIAGVEAARDATKARLEQVEFGLWPEDFIGWAEWIEALGFDASLIRDWAHYIGPGWELFPFGLSPAGLETIAVLLEGAGVDATWLRAEADRWKREGLVELALGPGERLVVGPKEIAGVFTPAIDRLKLASASLADASAWLQLWPDALERLERADVPLRFFPLEMTADDVDAWADEVEAAGLDAGWLRAEADRLRQEGLMWSLTPQDFYRAFTPVIENLDLALGSLAYTSEYLGTLQDNLERVKQLAGENIARTREFLEEAQTNLKAVRRPTLDGIASTREFLKTTKTGIDGLEEPVLASISHGRDLLRTARTSLEAAQEPITDGLAGSRAALQATETSVAAAKSPVISGIAGTRELLDTAKTNLGEIRTPALGGISDTREFLQKTAQPALGGLAVDLRATSEGIVELGIGEMILTMIGWLQTYMIFTSILFMAAGAGLFLVGMKKAEKTES